MKTVKADTRYRHTEFGILSNTIWVDSIASEWVFFVFK